MLKWQGSETRLQKSVLAAGRSGMSVSVSVSVRVSVRVRRTSSLLPILPQAGMLQAPQKDLCKPKLVIVNVNEVRTDYPS